jgi:hypothetical protein
MDEDGIRVDGHSASDETIAAWKAIRSNQQTRYDLQIGAKAATMTIDVTDSDAYIRENTFYGNNELLGVLALLSTDLKQQETASALTTGGSSTLTQSLSLQNTLVTQPDSPLLSPFSPCDEARLVLAAATTNVNRDCAGTCFTGWLRFVDRAVPVCGPCRQDMGLEADAKQDCNKKCGGSGSSGC